MNVSAFLVIGGCAGIAAGILALAWPGMTLGFLISVFGAYAIFDGLSNLLHGLTESSMQGRSWATFAEGFVGVAIGMVAALWPGLTVLMLVALVGTWAIARGVFEVIEAVRLRHYVTGEWLLGLSGLVSLLFGLFMFASPVGGVVGLAWLLGIYAMAMGVARIVLGAEIQSSVTA
jgi:uncharacterized membrane protein HdeD (DUF308 family)